MFVWPVFPWWVGVTALVVLAVLVMLAPPDDQG